MGDLFWGWLLMGSSLSGIITFYKTFRRRRETESAFWLLLLSVSTALWAITYALFFLLPWEGAALFFYEIRYATIMLSGWFMFLFIFHTLKHRMFARPTLALFMLFPVANTAVLLTNRYTGLFITFFGLATQNGLRAPLYRYGPWFLFHCVFSYVPLLIGAVIIVNQYLRLPAKHKALVGLLFLGMSVTFFTTILSVFDLTPYPVDLSPLVIQATQVIFYYTLFNSRSLDMIFASRNAMFENSNSILLIIDIDGTIVDYNAKAREIAGRLHMGNLTGLQAESFIQGWQSAARCHVFEQDPSIFTIVEDNADTSYQVQNHSILGKHGEPKGSYMEIKNIKPIMTLIHMLQDAAYYDQLTGLPNRNYFARKLTEIDVPASYPICVMVGDVNGLKRVNDTYGHVKGDELLRRISGILLSHAPSGAFFSRTGGDEFIGLLPNTAARQADGFVRRVEKCCAAVEDPEFHGASIALGYKIKNAAQENIEELIHAADHEMYATKRNRRAAQ